tara:strand:+ start:573 stop:1034 length:462 start_codon:yes stop_codon:yes gene_type:complete
MDSQQFFYFWLILGTVVVLLEFIVPGGIVIFIGIAALFVAGLIYFDWIHSLIESLTYWFIFSLLLLFSLRGIVNRFLKPQVSVVNTDEDIDAIGHPAIVIEEITAEQPGRIHFRGTSWSASSKDPTPLKKDQKVIIIGRENIHWIVRPIQKED